MWVLIFLFMLITLALAWMLFGYLLLVWFMGLFQKKSTPQFPASWPVISMIVPCYNEEEQILEKLEDLRQLDYPAELLEVVFCDGGSTDRTVELLQSEIASHEPFRIVSCPSKGKIKQLNHVLPLLKGEIIVNSDADSRLSKDALKWLSAEFANAPYVWVVGAYCYPGKTLEAERYYWDAQNKGRFLESDAKTSSIVIAQCYAFRKELLTAFPEDVIADDIYVAFLAHAQGLRVVYSRHVSAVEMRGPQSYEEFLPHKFRKSNAFLRESLRFLYRLPELSSFCKMMLFTRIAQQLFLPWGMLLWILTAGALLTLFRFDIVILDIGFLLSVLILTSRIFAGIKLPDEHARRYPLLTVVEVYAITNLIMLATGLTYPFFRQNSSYSRLTTPQAKSSSCLKKHSGHSPNTPQVVYDPKGKLS